ncbi:MAG: hypothetical protein PHX04_04285 [Bacilli bacterium]|nr:hypothetical protein [Bacilli bacterium]
MDLRNQVLLSLSGLLLMLLITIGISYAYFTATMAGGEESTTITVKGGKMTITYDSTGSNINLANIIPDDNPAAIKNFTIKGNNNTDIEMCYKISLVVTTNTFSEEAIQYKLSSTNTDNNGSVAASITDLTIIGTGAKTVELGVGYFDAPAVGDKIHTYNLEIYFPNQNYNQNGDQEKQIQAHVTVENFDCSTLLPYDKTKGVNRPVLFTGMTPVKWDDVFKETETTKDDSTWYDYGNQKWANAKTIDGSYWVWIPRYAYKITSGYHSSTGAGEETAGTIDIEFLKGETNANKNDTPIETTGYNPEVKDTSMHHFLHPAFDV